MTPSVLPPVLLAFLAAPPGAAAPAKRCAIVCQLQGRATMAAAGKPARDLALYDWLPPGGQLETTAGARLGLVFAGGERFEMEGEAAAVLEPRGLRAMRGAVARREPLPMIPDMARSARAEVRGRPGSVTVRRPGPPQPWWSAFHPAADGAALATEAVLGFVPVTPGGRHGIEVFDAQGEVIHRATVEGARLVLPPGLLRPGAWYAWRAVPEGTTEARPLEARFHTVEARHAEVRARLVEAAAKDRKGEATILLQAMDRWLGLEPAP